MTYYVYIQQILKCYILYAIWHHCMAFKHSISFATDLAANFGCYRFRITPDIVSKLLRATIWSHCAILFESEQTLVPMTGSQFRSAALHRIQFGTWGFVPMSIFLLGDWWLIKRLRDWCCFGWEIGAALVDCFGQKTKAAPEEIVLLWLTTFLPIPLKISFHKKIAS